MVVLINATQKQKNTRNIIEDRIESMSNQLRNNQCRIESIKEEWQWNLMGFGCWKWRAKKKKKVLIKDKKIEEGKKCDNQISDIFLSSLCGLVDGFFFLTHN